MDYSAVKQIANKVWITNEQKNFPILHLSNDYGKITVALQGGQILSYQPIDQREVFFIADNSQYFVGNCVRGGVPLCWPWFGKHPTSESQPKHGLVRKQFMQVLAVDELAKGELAVNLSWDYQQISCRYRIVLGQKLQLTLCSLNRSNSTQTIGGGLHPYFQLSNISQSYITGLKESSYYDYEREENHVMLEEKWYLNEETNYVFYPQNSIVKLVDLAWQRVITVAKKGSNTTIVWNPWLEGSSEISDLARDDYRSFVCIEPCAFNDDVYHLKPQQSHTLTTTISVDSI